MGMILDSECFDLRDISAASAGMRDLVAGYAGKTGCVAEVSIHLGGTERQQKLAAVRLLKKLVEDGGVKGWRRGGYEFFFDDHAYFWKGRELYFTAGEELFLYRWLVFGKYVERQRYFLVNLRQKFGKDFLVPLPEDEPAVVYV
jgi:hypothetical protein